VAAAARKRVVPLHDLHHVLTGYGTDWVGEAEIGAWELRAGCDSFVAYFLNGGGVLIGIFLSPGRLWRAFRAAKGQQTLYRDAAEYDSIPRRTVGEVRRKLGIPPPRKSQRSPITGARLRDDPTHDPWTK
jgi:hypothetical protein